jgi:Fic family protein
MEFAGRYRTSNVFIGGAEHVPPDALQVPLEMEKLINWFTQKRKDLHPIELSALLHHKLVYIHPFFDGNGRMARLVMNLILMRAGFPLSVILKNDRKKYYRVLALADKEDTRPIIRFISSVVERSLDIYLKVLTPANQPRENFKSLLEISKGTPYSEKYLNLLARSGRLEAHKQGRNWLTRIEALKRYVDSRQRKRKISYST